MKQNSLSYHPYDHAKALAGGEREGEHPKKNLLGGEGEAGLVRPTMTRPLLGGGGGAPPRAGSKDFFEDEREMPVQLTLSP
ncbi:hypothetical protein CSUI_011184 [Cystoisospora suis]|uniref:Uncharacterized protein n=1 Tax=Cystoisospora suis TaxID=483139 RepID=A0A2C6KEZ8_9APIC|nr:hypothetical protein CSUI_011184 [Cystoisospora suis]